MPEGTKWISTPNQPPLNRARVLACFREGLHDWSDQIAMSVEQCNLFHGICSAAPKKLPRQLALAGATMESRA